MEPKRFWSGFAAGTCAALGALWACDRLGRGGRSRIVRLEKSVQIGRPVNEVFERWQRWEDLSEYSSIIRSVKRQGELWHWHISIEGREFEWDAELTQVIPNQSIGWKSVSGTKHSGRVTFSPMGNDTLVHVQMNYAPPMRALRPMAGAVSGRLEGYIEQALRDFKANMEAKEGAWRFSNLAARQRERA